jgi:hypothetical protein
MRAGPKKIVAADQRWGNAARAALGGATSITASSIFNPDGVLEHRYEDFNHEEIRCFVKKVCFVA